MAKINLLPASDIKKGLIGSFLKYVDWLNSFLALITAVLLIAAGGILAKSIFEKSDLAKRKEAISASIKELETTEQKLVLVSDRLLYARDILAKKGALAPLQTFAEIVPAIPTEATISSFDVSPDRTTLSASVITSAGLKSLLDLVSSLPSYREIVAESINYSPENGYFLTLTAYHK